MRHRIYPIAVTLLVLVMPLHAAEVMMLEGCTDHRGRTVATEADYQQRVLVQTVETPAEPVIRHNPRVLPQLSPAVRQFFFAYECARNALGTAGTAALTPAQAHQADCVGLNTLLLGGLMARDELADLQQQLVFSDAEWAQLPGPVRSIDLTTCRQGGNVLKLPVATPPSGQQSAWNACVHACGDRSWQCQKACRGASCDSCAAAYSACQAACGEASAK